MRHVTRVFLLLAAAVVVPACGDDGDSSPPGPPTSGDLEPGFGSGGVVVVNPDPGPFDEFEDAAMDVAGDRVYLVGGVGDGAANYLWRIEKRLLSDGSLDPAFGVNGVLEIDPDPTLFELEAAVAISIDSTYMYVLGYYYDSGSGDHGWRIEKRYLVDGAPVTGFGSGGTYEEINPSAGTDAPADLVLSGSWMLLLGYDEEAGAGDSQWRIEKRSQATAALDTAFNNAVTPGYLQINPSSGEDEPSEIAVDGTWMYVAGNSLTVLGDSQWHVEKRSISLGALNGTFGSGGVLRLDHSSIPGGDDELRGITIDTAGGCFYLVGDDRVNGMFDARWRTEKRFLSDGTLDTTFNASGAIPGVVLYDPPGGGFDFAVGAYLDGSDLYVSGLRHFNPPLPNQDLRGEIHKLDAASGAPVTSFGSGGVAVSNPTPLVDGVAVFGADATHIYLGGLQNFDLLNDPPASDIAWRIEKRLR